MSALAWKIVLAIALGSLAGALLRQAPILARMAVVHIVVAIVAAAFGIDLIRWARIANG